MASKSKIAKAKKPSKFSTRRHMRCKLCGRPRALILDEPDWGLTRSSAVALVAAVIKAAHAFGIPVVLISHKPWWLTVAKSIIRVERGPKKSDDPGADAFRIRLSCDRIADETEGRLNQ